MEKNKRTYLNLQVRGLNTFQSDLSEVPVGALQVADNFVIDKEGILETRRGIRDRLTVPSVVAEATPYIRSFHKYGSNLLMHVESIKTDDTGFTTTFHYLYQTDDILKEPVQVPAASATPPQETGNIYSTEFKSNLFYTHNDGIYKVDRIDRTPTFAGITRGIALDYGINEVLDKDAVELLDNPRETPIEIAATRDEDPFEIKISKDQNVDIIAGVDTVKLNFENTFELADDPVLYEVSIAADSGLNGNPGVYNLLDGGNGSMVLPQEVVDLPEIDYTIPAGELTLLEDPNNENNIVIELPPGSPTPPEGLVNRQMRIETGTFDDSPGFTLDILAVKENRITIRNIFNWEPSEFTFSEGTRARINIAEDTNRISITNLPRSLSFYRRPTITFPPGFLKIPTELKFDNLFASRGRPNSVTFISEELAAQKDILDAATTNTYTLLAGKTFEAFCMHYGVFLKLPLNRSNTNIETSNEDTTGYDISRASDLIVEADSIPVNPQNPSAGLNPTKDDASIYEVLYDDAPPVPTNAYPEDIPSAGEDHFWLRIDRFTNPGPFRDWGVIDRISQAVLSEPLHLRTWAENTSWELQITVATTIFNAYQRGDWVYIPENTFLPLSDPVQARVFHLYQRNFGTDGKETKLQIEVDSEDDGKWGDTGSYRYNNPNNSLSFYRPNQTFTPSKDVVIRARPTSSYQFPLDVKINYSIGTVIANRPIQIGTFKGSRRLNRDLYIYRTVKEHINSEQFVMTGTSQFTLPVSRITSAERRGVSNLRVYVDPNITPEENNILGSVSFEIPSDTTFLGISGETLEYAGGAGGSFTLRLTPDQVTTVEAAIANGDPVLSKDLTFDYEDEDIPILKIESIEGDELTETIKLIYEVLPEADEEVFDEVLEKATNILLPQGSTFLGIPGLASFNISNYKRQTTTSGAEVTITPGTFNYAELVSTAAPYVEGRYFIGDFTVGVINRFTTTSESKALNSNGQYSYRVLWTYEDDKKNLIVGEPSEALIVTRQEGQRPVDLDLIVDVPIEIKLSSDISKFKYEIYRSSRSANAESPPSGDEALIKSNTIGKNTLGQFLKRFVVTDDVTDNDRGKALYTNSNQEGIEGANMRPPRALI